MRIIDIRGRVAPASEPPPHYFSHRTDYEKSHIPNASFVDWTRDIVDVTSPSYDIASPEQFASLMSELGISSKTQVVVYDDASGMFAARFWWALNYYGHQNVAVLDGGWQKWVAESHPVSAEVPTIEPTEFVPQIQASWRVTSNDILEKDKVLIDVRSSSEYQGESSRASRFGHIPGAINLPRKQLLNSDGTLISSEAIHKILKDSGIHSALDDPIIYCNSGVSASFLLLALKTVGLSSGSVYDGSWKDWGNDEQYPIER